jgi:hypothetical protein
MSDVTLKEHLEQSIRFLDRHYDSKIEAMDRFYEAQNFAMRENVKTANAELNARLAGMNEFRDTLKDQAGTLASKAEVQAVEKSVRVLELSKENLAGRATTAAVLWSAAVSIVVGLITGFLCWKLFK